MPFWLDETPHVSKPCSLVAKVVALMIFGDGTLHNSAEVEMSKHDRLPCNDNVKTCDSSAGLNDL
jgi:hypothetical protein